jgi:hypothetical protein
MSSLHLWAIRASKAHIVASSTDDNHKLSPAINAIYNFRVITTDIAEGGHI